VLIHGVAKAVAGRAWQASCRTNPSTGNQKAKPLMIELEGGQTAAVTVSAK